MAASEGLPARSPLTSSPHRSQISMAMPLQGITPGPIIEIRRSSSTSTYSNSLPHPVTTGRKSTYNSMLNTITTFALFFIFVIIDEIPRQTYSYFLLRIPTLYLSRVTRIFEEARLSLPDIKRMARTQAEKWDEKNPTPLLLIHQDYAVLPRSLLHFKSSWDSFIDSLMREWKTLNVISVLLMSAILTLLQIDAASHPITRTTALFSLICSLMSLLYGCIYIIRFGSMRKIHKAVSFGNDAQQNVGFLWNVWIMLAMPAIWLAWSIITFFASIMSFVWLTGSSHDPIDVVLSVRAALGLRIALSVVFGLGLLYFALIVKEFHRYGDPLDAAWQRAVQEWAREYEYPTRPPFVTLSQPYGRYKPPLRPNFTTPRSPDDSLSQYPLQREPSLIQTRSPTSSRRSRSPSRPPPTYIRQIDQLDQHELFEEVVAEHDKIAPELPAAFLRSFVVDEEPILLPPTTVMHLGRQEDSTHFNSHALKLTQAPLDISQTMHKEDWDRFVVDVSSAWKGDLTLVKAPGDQYSYRVVEPPPPPPRPTAPTPPSPAPKSPKTRVNWTRSLPASPDETISSQGPRKLAAVTEEDDPSTPTRLNASPATQKDDMISVSNSQSPTNIYMGGVSMLSDGPSRTRTLSSERPQAQVVQEFINLWNERYFFPRNLSVRLAPADRWAENAEFDVIMSHTWRHVQEEDMASRDPRPNMKSSSPVSGSEVGGGGSKLFRTADENDETLKQRSIP
ncbi:hypothetical protein MIND_00313400 [Mycena indigotica]|uniref:Uncharacterized protein n=1 Tax=Mycena indigotica TaxID=2126181 RepID=A0A8H6T1Q3_9AGAR|nr:uncharacterized protein MIND_00313400 [Mycena indigotica]KAF7309426.1 hypothetical protein MIND_00313400 [Mycena indigotica]